MGLELQIYFVFIFRKKPLELPFFIATFAYHIE